MDFLYSPQFSICQDKSCLTYPFTDKHDGTTSSVGQGPEVQGVVRVEGELLHIPMLPLMHYCMIWLAAWCEAFLYPVGQNFP